MKRSFIVISLLMLVGIAFGLTYLENFDTDTNWAGGTMGGYNAKTYTNSADPANDGFSTDSAVRETAYTYPTPSTGYAWRVDDVGPFYFRYECSETVNGFSMWMARWDNSPVPYFTIRYSVDSGSSYTDITSLDGNWFTGDKIYKQYSYTFSTPISPENGQTIYIESITTGGERLLIDYFELDYTPSSTPTVDTPVIDPAGGYKYSSFNATITCATSGSTIYYTTDGSDPDNTDTEYLGPINISDTTILKAIAYATGYDPSAVASETYTFPIEVSDIATLSAGTIGTLYKLTGEAVLTFKYSYNNQKWVQDASGAILLYDSSENITTNYSIGDGITGIIGTLAAYHGLIELYPTTDPGTASSTGNTVTPEVKTLASITSADQSKLIRINGVSFSDTGNFANGTHYTITDASAKASGDFFTNFYSVDYIGTPIPTTEGDLVCLVGWYDAAQFTPRDLNDFIDFAAVPVMTVSTETLSGFTYVFGSGFSAEQSFTVSGTDLTGDITITPPTNYEISLGTDAKAFVPTNPITLTPTAGEVATTTIYVRLKAGLAIGTYNGEVINITSGTAEAKTVTCGGEVTSPPPPGTPVVDEPTDIGPDSFTANWNAVPGATGYYLDVYTLEAGGYASDLIISEYVEGSGYNKAIEIYNGTGVTVDLGSYILKKQTNGAGDYGSDLALSGSLVNDDVYVIAYNGNTPNLASEPYVDLATNSQALNFNGNDAVALFKDDGRAIVQVDVVGIFNQVSPNWGADVTLVRKSSITSPSVTFSVDDWDSYPQNTFTYLGSHTMSGATLTYVTGYENLNVGDVTSYPVTGLQPNTMYYYVVRAYNDYGTSESSGEMALPGEGTVPVELSSFTAMVTSENFVALHWTTQSETNVQGYYIYRNTVDELNSAYRIPALVAATNTSQEANYTFVDEDVASNNTYYYWLQNLDMDGSFEFHGPINVTINYNDGGDTPPVIPTKTELLAAYPNPFNPVTHLRYSLKTAGFVTIDVYNNRGQLIRSFSNDHPAAGYYQMVWDGRDMNGKSVSSGIYYYRMTSGKYTSSKKVVLLK